MIKFPCFVHSASLFNRMFVEFLQTTSGDFGFVCRGEMGSDDICVEWHSPNQYVFPVPTTKLS